MRDEDPKVTMKRIEAIVMAARINAFNTGGDRATAADLMCAFVLMVMRGGADLDRARDAMWHHAKAVCEDWWGGERRKVQWPRCVTKQKTLKTRWPL